MRKVTVIELEKDIEIPETWAELTPEQALFVYEQYFYAHRKIIDLHTFFSRLLDCFIFGKTKIKKRDKAQWSPFSTELARVFFDFLFNITANGLELNFTETKNFMPVLKLGNMEFTGRKSNLSDLTFEEFEATNMYLNEYASGDTESIYSFIACLYRPEWEVFYEENLEQNAGIIKKYGKETWKFEMIMLWYCNCIREIQTEDIYYNGNIVNFSVLFKKEENEENEDKEQKQKNNLGWLPIIYDFAEKGIFGNLEQTKKANL